MTTESDPPVRPEVVDAIVAAVMKTDVGELMPLLATGVTPAEKKRADELIVSMLLARRDIRDAEGGCQT